MELHDPSAERALILSVTGDEGFAEAVAIARSGLIDTEPGWLPMTAPDIVARAERRAVALCADILDLAMLAPRLRPDERPALNAGLRQIVRSAYCGYAACRALTPVAERADSIEELAA